MGIREWIKYRTSVWNKEHEELAAEIALKLVWYRPGIRKRILKEVENDLKRLKDSDEDESSNNINSH
jgi:hypothetical protein